MATVILRQAGTRPAKNAHIVWGGERDGVSSHADLEGIVDIDPESPPDLHGDHDPTQFIDPSYDAAGADR